MADCNMAMSHAFRALFAVLAAAALLVSDPCEAADSDIVINNRPMTTLPPMKNSRRSLESIR